MEIKQYLRRAGLLLTGTALLATQYGCKSKCEREAEKLKEAQEIVEKYEKIQKKAQDEIHIKQRQEFVKDSTYTAKVVKAAVAAADSVYKSHERDHPQSNGNSNRGNCGRSELEESLREHGEKRTVVIQFITNGNPTENKSDNSKSSSNNTYKTDKTEKNQHIRALQNKHNENIYMMSIGIDDEKTPTYWENDGGNVISVARYNLRPRDWEVVEFKSIDAFLERFGKDYSLNGVRVSTLPPEYVRAFKDTFMYAPGWVPRSGFVNPTNIDGYSARAAFRRPIDAWLKGN